MCLAAALIAGQSSLGPLRPPQDAPAVQKAPESSPTLEAAQRPPERLVAAIAEPEARAEPIPRSLEPVEEATAVIGSYFGPGLFGNRTACGSTLTTELVGVAHRTLPCGAEVTLRHGATTVTVPVVDRGPFVYSREFDLTYATKVALGCPDLCSLSWLR